MYRGKSFLPKAFFFCLISFLIAEQATAQSARSPEFSSFEPTEAPDMVNLATGDFTYVLPLFEVPAPGGSYPISMHYHAGIAMDQEASWTGLGWNLNVGGINRHISGFPDDWDNVGSSSFIWNPGETNSFWSFGAMAGVGNLTSVGLGINWSSYKGYGGTASFGLGFKDTPLSISTSTSTDMNASIQAGIRNESGMMSASTGVSISPNTGISGNSSISLGAGGARNSLGVTYSAAGAESHYSNIIGTTSLSTLSTTTSVDDWTVLEDNYYLPLFTPYGSVYASWGERMHYMHKEDENAAFGSIYSSNAYEQQTGDNTYHGVQSSKKNMDMYSYSSSMEDFSSRDEYNEHRFAFLAYDNYAVTAEGLGGTMRPHFYENGIIVGKNEGLGSSGGSEYENRYYFNSHKLQKNSENVFFSFDKTYDSKHRILSQDIAYSGNGNYSAMWDYDPVGLNNALTATNHNIGDDRKNSSRIIEYFTNKQITDHLSASRQRGFMESLDAPNRNSLEEDGIGAFTIKAEDGKSYHFSIPVLSKHELTEVVNGSTIYIEEQTKSYATNWLLTSITGPDYVDVNNNNRLDKGDDGFWMIFRYGKWNDGYLWKNPFFGVDQADGAEVKRFGIKEMYYLDAIESETHTALFIKSLREDGLSTGGVGGTFEFPNRKVVSRGRMHWTDLEANFTKTGGSTLYTGFPIQVYDMWKHIQIQPTTAKASPLKLDRIVLLKNEDLPMSIDQLREEGSGISSTQPYVNTYHKKYVRVVEGKLVNVHGVDIGTYDYSVAGRQHAIYENVYSKTFQNHLSNNVIDASDLISIQLKSLQEIELNHNYSLAALSPNSISTANQSTGDGYSCKLTLNSVQFQGQNATKYSPDYSFSYYSLGDYDEDAIDNWGYYSPVSNLDYELKNQVHNWSLQKIVEPDGREIEIQYESDRYDYEAARCAPSVNERRILGIVQQISSSPTVYEWDEEYRSPEITPSGYGGGIRVKALIRRNGQKEYKNEYEYHGGVTSYSPGRYDSDTDYYKLTNGLQSDTRIVRRSSSSNPTIHPDAEEVDYHNFIPYQTDLPSPGVVYKKVTVNSKNSNGDRVLSTDFEFEVMPRVSSCIDISTDYTIGNFFSVKSEQYVHGINRSGVSAQQIKQNSLKRIVLRDNTGKIGRLNSISTFNSNDELTNRKEMNYLDFNVDGGTDDVYGVSQETFHTITRFVHYWANRNNWSSTYYITSNSKIEFPSPVLSMSSTYSNGHNSRVNYSNYDLNTGKPLESRYTNSFGKEYKTIFTPAYTHYPFMGSSLANQSYKNMLTQGAGELVYTNEPSSVSWRLVSANATKWSNDWKKRTFNNGTQTYAWQTPAQGVWRKQGNYVWNSLLHHNKDGTITSTGNSSEKFKAYDYIDPSNNEAEHWVNASTISRYDQHSRPIEVIDPNGLKSSMKYDNKQQILLQANVGKYEDVYFSSAEDLLANGYFSSELQLSTGQVTTFRAHTGIHSVQINGGDETFVIRRTIGNSNSDLDKTSYLFSAWVNTGNPSQAVLFVDPANGSEITSSNVVLEAGDWRLYQMAVDVSSINNPGTHIDFGVRCTSGTAYVDDFRFHPVGASLTGYVYNEYGQITHMLDANNIGTAYGYTDAGELEEIKREVADKNPGDGGFKLMSRQNKIYGRGL